jgi:hypothetical protein
MKCPRAAWSAASSFSAISKDKVIVISQEQVLALPGTMYRDLPMLRTVGSTHVLAVRPQHGLSFVPQGFCLFFLSSLDLLS